MGTYFIIGGTGIGAGFPTLAGGAADDSVAWVDAQGSDGSPLESHTAGWGASVSDSGGSVRITGSNGDLSAAVVGVYAACIFDATYSNGRYKITAIDSTNGAYIEIDLTFAGTTMVDQCYVGGALGGGGNPEYVTTDIQAVLDLAVAGDTIKVACNQSSVTTYLVDTQLDIDQNSGSLNSPITITGVDNIDGTVLTPTSKWPIIFAVASIASMVEINTKHYWEFQYVDFDGDTDQANTCLNVRPASGTGCNLYNIRARNSAGAAGVKGVNWIGGSCSIINCEIDGHVSTGLQAGVNTHVLGCSIHDNGANGVNIGNENVLEHSLIYANTADGINAFGSVDKWTVANCTIDNNGSDGIAFPDGSENNRVYNCCITNSGAYGFAFSDASGYLQQLVISNCLWYGNTTDDLNHGSLATLGQGGHIEADPLYADSANGDYRLKATSPIWNKGIPLPIDGYSTPGAWDRINLAREV